LLLGCFKVTFDLEQADSYAPALPTRGVTWSCWDKRLGLARAHLFLSMALPTFLDRVMLPTSHGNANAYGLPTEVWRTLDLHPETVTI
jgi:hypothetical protein